MEFKGKRDYNQVKSLFYGLKSQINFTVKLSLALHMVNISEMLLHNVAKVQQICINL